MNGGIWHFPSCRDSRKKKFSVSPVQRAEKPFSKVSLAEKKKAPYTPEFAATKSKILPQYQISLIAHFVLAGILLGSAFPKPCSCGLRRLKILKNLFRIIKKQFRFTPCFSPISERTPRTERRSTTYETIQHAPPQPCSQDPADR